MNFIKYSNLARKSLKFYKQVVTLLNFFMKLLSNIYLEFLKSFFFINLGKISSIYLSFELIHRDTVPLRSYKTRFADHSTPCHHFQMLMYRI